MQKNRPFRGWPIPSTSTPIPTPTQKTRFTMEKPRGICQRKGRHPCFSKAQIDWCWGLYFLPTAPRRCSDGSVDTASRRGWTIFREYVDQGVSGCRESRPELNRLMTDAHQRKIDAVLVWKIAYSRSSANCISGFCPLHVETLAYRATRMNIFLRECFALPPHVLLIQDDVLAGNFQYEPVPKHHLYLFVTSPLDDCDTATEYCHTVALFQGALPLPADVILLACLD
jgi:Resolvase, N terminal domain